MDSPRANEGRDGDPYRQANISCSLVQRKEGQIVRHTLIDCSLDIAPLLLEFSAAVAPTFSIRFRSPTCNCWKPQF